MSEIVIDNRRIGPEFPPYIIAEMSGNHNGDLNRALALIDAAKESGADAVKMQTYTADTLTIDCDLPDFKIKKGLWAGRKLYDLYKEAHTPWGWHDDLFSHARNIGISIFSSPFDETAVDFLEGINAPAFKIASFEAVDIPLIKKTASAGKPLIISTGMANIDEISEAVSAAREGGAQQIALLHCISGYPTPAEDCNLRTIEDLRERFNVVVGLSDHTLGTAVSVAGVARGASIIEKHFTLKRSDGGPDAAFSLEPNELKELCQNCRTAWTALGQPSYSRAASEEENIMFRRSLYVVKDVLAGEEFSPENVRSIRPGYGLSPSLLPDVLGKSARMNVSRGTPFSMDMISEQS